MLYLSHTNVVMIHKTLVCFFFFCTIVHLRYRHDQVVVLVSFSLIFTILARCYFVSPVQRCVEKYDIIINNHEGFVYLLCPKHFVFFYCSGSLLFRFTVLARCYDITVGPQMTMMKNKKIFF